MPLFIPIHTVLRYRYTKSIVLDPPLPALPTGTVRGLVECLESYPLDTIKTGMQAQPGAGSLTRFFRVIKEDGSMGLYRRARKQDGLIAKFLQSIHDI